MITSLCIKKRGGGHRWVIIVAFVAVLSVAAENQTESWKAPVRKAKVKNPIPADKASIASGRDVFTAACAACHGDSGRGDGPAATALDPKPGDLTKASRMREQSDGELFWKISTGRTPMPAFKDAVTDDQIWQVVNFIRTLSPDSKVAKTNNTPSK